MQSYLPTALTSARERVGRLRWVGSSGKHMHRRTIAHFPGPNKRVCLVECQSRRDDRPIRAQEALRARSKNHAETVCTKNGAIECVKICQVDKNCCSIDAIPMWIN